MPDPVWTSSYNYAQSPEQNGFTRTLYNDPVVTEITSGNPANRRVEINSNNGDVVFLTSSVPSLDSSVGATAEAVVNVSGAGDAGFELTFLNMGTLIQVLQNSILLSFCNDFGGYQEFLFSTSPNNVDITIRFTVDGSRQARLYRNTVLIDGPRTIPVCIKPFQRVLWWGESGGTQIFKGMKYYIGGAVVPG